MTPGIHKGVPFEEYRRWPLPSYSVVKHGVGDEGCAAAIRDYIKHPPTPTDDMLLGSAVHCAVLEPEMAAARVVCWESTRKGDAWERFRTANAQRIILTESMHERFVRMVRAVRSCHRFKSEFIPAFEDVEVSCVASVDGVLVKGRADALLPDTIVDVKKISNVSNYTISNQVASLKYYIQAGLYCHIFNRPRFLFVFVSESGRVVYREMSPSYLRAGLRDFRVGLAMWKKGTTTGEWPGMSTETVMLEPAPWLGVSDEFDD